MARLLGTARSRRLRCGLPDVDSDSWVRLAIFVFFFQVGAKTRLPCAGSLTVWGDNCFLVYTRHVRMSPRSAAAAGFSSEFSEDGGSGKSRPNISVSIANPSTSSAPSSPTSHGDVVDGRPHSRSMFGTASSAPTSRSPMFSRPVHSSPLTPGGVGRRTSVLTGSGAAASSSSAHHPAASSISPEDGVWKCSGYVLVAVVAVVVAVEVEMEGREAGRDGEYSHVPALPV